jgi:hypothetical protein
MLLAEVSRMSESLDPVAVDFRQALSAVQAVADPWVRAIPETARAEMRELVAGNRAPSPFCRA